MFVRIMQIRIIIIWLIYRYITDIEIFRYDIAYVSDIEFLISLSELLV
jgi:hypothetical protein